MKKKLTYRDKLLELAKIYNVKEIQDYIKSKKSLTSGQIELILRKNKIIIPKDFQTNFYKENVTKPLSKVSRQIDDLKEDSIKSINRFSRQVNYFKEDSKTSFKNFIYNIWKFVGKIGLGFLEVLPRAGKAISNFISSSFVELFNEIYNQKINVVKANKAIISFFIIIGVGTIIVSGVNVYKNSEKFFEKNKTIKTEDKIKKLDSQTQKKVKKLEPKPKQELQKVEPKNKEEKVAEVILPNLNLKTETVLSLFKDVDYDLNTVRYEKKVKPIYFTQFPRDLDEIQSVKLKKETFIKIVLPLIVAENEKILADRSKLKKITSRRITSDEEKQWLRQKLLEYKVKKSDVEELENRMDIIPTSIALAQAAKESGWGTSRFALEGNAIFGQWTWTGRGIAPLDRDKTKNHKILKFPILRASVKAYKNNLNTHKSYVKFRNKRKELRKKNKKISGLELTKTLDNYAETGSEYTKILAQIINQNRLMDFELVTLTNSGKKHQLDL